MKVLSVFIILFDWYCYLRSYLNNKGIVLVVVLLFIFIIYNSGIYFLENFVENKK